MGGRLELSTSSAEETRKLGAGVAALLGPGDVVTLTGDLGAGKTCLVQGAAKAMGVEEQVASPTFVLVREYLGEVPIHHLDVYRLDRMQEVIDLGFEDLLDPSGVMFVEWGDAIEALLPDSYLEIAITTSPEDDARRFVLHGHGRSWATRWERLGHELGAWEVA